MGISLLAIFVYFAQFAQLDNENYGHPWDCLTKNKPFVKMEKQGDKLQHVANGGSRMKYSKELLKLGKHFENHMPGPSFTIWAYPLEAKPTFPFPYIAEQVLKEGIPTWDMVAVKIPGKLFGLSESNSAPVPAVAVIGVKSDESWTWGKIKKLALTAARCSVSAKFLEPSLPPPTELLLRGIAIFEKPLAFDNESRNWWAQIVQEGMDSTNPLLRNSQIGVCTQHGILPLAFLMMDPKRGYPPDPWLDQALQKVLEAVGPPWLLKAKIPDVAFASAKLCELFLEKETPETTEPSVPAASVAKPEFIFRKQGQGWFIRAFGKEGWFPDIAGCWYLYRLLTSPRGEVRMAELVMVDSPVSEKIEKDYQEDIQKGQPDLLADPNAIQAAKDRLQEIKDRLHDPEFPPDWEEARELEEEQEKLEKYLESVQGLGKQPRKMADPIDKLRPLIRVALRTAFRKLRDNHMEELAEHFEKNVRASGDCYQYNNRLPWNEL